jgi:preprotein translocase subunit SecA
LLFASDEDSIKTMTQYHEQTVADIVKAQTGDDGSINVDKVMEKISQFFSAVGSVLQKSDLEGKDQAEVTAFVTVAVDEIFRGKAAALDEKAKAAGNAPNSIGRSARYITFVTMDNAWSDHLQAMENLKESVVLRQFQGLDPLQEYQQEAFQLFKGLEDTMRFNAVFSLWQSI